MKWNEQELNFLEKISDLITETFECGDLTFKKMLKIAKFSIRNLEKNERFYQKEVIENGKTMEEAYNRENKNFIKTFKKELKK